MKKLITFQKDTIFIKKLNKVLSEQFHIEDFTIRSDDKNSYIYFNDDHLVNESFLLSIVYFINGFYCASETTSEIVSDLDTVYYSINQ